MTLQPEDFWSFSEWLLRPGDFLESAALQGVVLFVVLALFGLIFSYIVSAISKGPGEAFYSVAGTLRDFFARDLPQTRFRRISALAGLAVREAIRRKVLVAIGIFVVGLMFAGLMLNTNTDDPAKLYISFVLTATNYLVLMLALLISTFSLPDDIKNKTIHTVVTKPVRPTEIIAGRVVGFTLVGTFALLLMGLTSYFFVRRSIQHTHTATAERVGDRIEGKTSYNANHQHVFTLNADGVGVTDMQQGHRHVVSDNGETIGPPEGNLEARVPVYGDLVFFDRSGVKSNKGINVGYEEAGGGFGSSGIARWFKKKVEPKRFEHAYIEGASLSYALFTFQNVRPQRFDEGEEGITMQMRLRAYRTFKGEIEIPVRGTITLRNPDKPQVTSKPRPFQVQEYLIDEHSFDAALEGTDAGVEKELDLYQDLVSEDGRLEIIIKCIDRGQYLGMTQGDLYLKAAESSFAWNLTKSYFCIWLQMVVIISLGVMFSTFLNGPVALVSTMVCLILGFSAESVFALSVGDTPGGGPLESVIRLVRQDAMTTELDVTSSTQVIVKVTDQIIIKILDAVATALPNLPRMNTSELVANGFDVFDSLVARHMATTFGYVLATCLIGYFFIKTREVAA